MKNFQKYKLIYYRAGASGPGLARRCRNAGCSMTGTVAHIKHFLSKSYIEFSGLVTKTVDLMTTISSDGQLPQQAPGKIPAYRGINFRKG